MGLGWTPISVVVPDDLCKRCGQYGRDLVADLKANRMDGRRMHSEWLIWQNQGMSKICEVAGALALGLDPETLDWDYTRPDRGWDFQFNEQRIDVKGTWNQQAHHLIYEYDKTPNFYEHEVDAFLLVWAVTWKRKRQFGYCEARGWMPKDDFGQLRYVVRKGDPRRFIPGSWIMHERDLRAMAELVPGISRDDRNTRAEIFARTAEAKTAGHGHRGAG